MTPQEAENDPEVRAAMERCAEAFSEMAKARVALHGSRRGHQPPEKPPVVFAPGATTLRQAQRALRGRGKGKKRTPTLEEQYAELIKAGQVRIERRRGKPPRVIWL